MGTQSLLNVFVVLFIADCPDLSLDHRFGMFKAYDGRLSKVYMLCSNEDGVDLLTGDRSSNLYTIALNEVASNSSTCLLAKASSLQSWLWHQRLSHLNFMTINNLVKNNLVQGLPKMKFEKYHLCSACEQGKIHQKHHKSKTAFASNKPLYLLHMDLCGPMRGKKEGVDGKLAGLLTASKVLDNLIESQRSDKNKEGLGYSVVPPPPAQLYLSFKKDLS
uniref:Retrovirus-related Pol polyprotein from transposon TNT 1-94 n=1 Tax=Tanacetum cinerariifolium TaxID=118510 RepID=A0A699KA52_TANCI|nr:retrovirus-related Pol polyprotein from transposon TNT 1-94 [Tanacetum cinerariifolium]